MAKPFGPPPKLSAEMLSGLIEKLRAFDYSESGLQGKLAFEFLYNLTSTNLPVNAFALREDLPEDLVVKLFFLQHDVALGAVEQVLSGEEISAFREGGLLTVDPSGKKVRSSVILWPFGELLFATDPIPPPKIPPSKRKRRQGKTGEEAADAGWVSPPGLDGLLLETFRWRGLSDATLILFPGAGFLPLFAARHSERVVALCPDSRSAEFTAFNAKLNGLSNIAVLEGSDYGPLKGERFDLVLANPQVSPRVGQYGVEGAYVDEDRLEEIVSGLPDCLAEKGLGQIACYLCADEEPDLADLFRHGLKDDPFSICYVSSAPMNAFQVLYGQGLYAFFKGDPETFRVRFMEVVQRLQMSAIQKVTFALFSLQRGRQFSFHRRELRHFLV